jgi:fermentation-respiration switch protein FrsA (DUF1100 family)
VTVPDTRTVVSSDEAVPSPRRRRRWLRITLRTAVVLVALSLVAAGGVGYYFAGVLLVADNSITYPVQVRAVDGDRVTLSRDPYSERPVVLGLQWEDGAAVLSSSVVVEGDSVVRTVTATLRGRLTAGLNATMDTRMYNGDPKTERGLDFDAIHFDSELGPMPAWYVPPTATEPTSTWVIAVHGRRGTMTEPLRILPTLAASGHPTLIMSYRNDPDAPPSPDGYYHLGDTEWRDVTAAIGYARAYGATGIVLYGWSMGGTLAMTALRRMPATGASLVDAVILDSPVIDWVSVLDLQGAQRNLPLPETKLAERVIELRGGFSLAALDSRPYAAQLDVPTLVFVDTTDTTVPVGPTLEFAAAARPGVVTLVKTTGGDHTGSWNANPDAYEARVTAFLSRLD